MGREERLWRQGSYEGVHRLMKEKELRKVE
jgi:hypothetical protein